MHDCNETKHGAGLRLKRAFSLIELLVVVAVVGVLIAVLVPSLSAAKRQGNAIKCLSNLHQLGNATVAYIATFDNSYPIAKDDSGSWDIAPGVDASGHPIAVSGVLYRTPGAVMTSLKVFMCPEYVLKSDPNALFTGYNYNTSFIGHGTGEAIQSPARSYQLKHPSTTALFGDGQYSAPNRFMRAPAPCNTDDDGGDSVTSNTRAAGTQGFRHSGKTNVLWADFHGEAWSTCVTQTPDGFPTAPGTGFLSADNSLYSIR